MDSERLRLQSEDPNGPTWSRYASWRARGSLLASSALCAGLAFATVSMLPPTYRSEARIAVDASIAPTVSGNSADAALTVADVAGRARLIASPDLARRVVARLDLVDDPEFADAPSSLRSLAGLLGLARLTAARGEERALSTFARRLDVATVDAGRVVRVGFTAGDPRKAERIASAVVDEYLSLALEAEIQVATDAAKRLAGEADVQRRRLAEAEAALADHRRAAPAVETRETRIAGLTADLAAARAARAEIDVRLRRLHRQSDGAAPLDASADASASPLAQHLRERLVGLRARAAELATVYLSAHPLVQDVAGQTADVERQLRTEAGRQASALSRDAEALDERVHALSTDLDSVRTEAPAPVVEDVESRALEAAVATERARLDETISHQDEGVAGAIAAAPRVAARLLTAPMVPSAPEGPRAGWVAAIVAAAVLGLAGLRVLVSALFGRLRRRLPAHEAPLVAGAVPIDGRVSDLRLDIPDVYRPLGFALPNALEHRAEVSIARIWSEIVATAGEGRRIVVTSATSDRAAHLAALAVLRIAARGHGRVCLVDVVGDLADFIGAEGMPGLSDLIAGEAQFSDVIFRDRASRGHVVVSGSAALSTEVLEGEVFANALDALDLTYDHVVLDVGRLRLDEGVARLVGSADAVVLAADGSAADPATLRAHEALASGGMGHVWLLAVDAGESRSLADLAA